MRTRSLVALGAVMVGAIWIAQGVGLLPGTSFMVGDGRWAIAGAALVALGIAFGFSAWRTRHRP